jgi:dihydroorotate dehydrogenase
MYKLLRSLLFLLPPEVSHHVTFGVMKFLFHIRLLNWFLPKFNNNAPVTVFGLRFKNPVGIAAGLDKNGDYIDCLAALGVGFIEVGAVTPKPQPGNAKPRLFRLTKQQALINRFGFNNKGVDYLVDRLKQRTCDCPVGVNLGKNKMTPLYDASQDYIICLEKVFLHADFATINISSPNTPGLRELQNEQYLFELLSAVKAKRDSLQQLHNKHFPLLVKISPDEDQQSLLKMLTTIERVGMDGIIATNATQQRAMLSDVSTAQEPGGLSGTPLTDLSFQALKTLLIEPIDLDIISLGGIDSATEAERRFSNGAKLIQIYTGLIYQGPALIKRCVKAAKKYC